MRQKLHTNYKLEVLIPNTDAVKDLHGEVVTVTKGKTNYSFKWIEVPEITLGSAKFPNKSIYSFRFVPINNSSKGDLKNLFGNSDDKNEEED